ncbi:MAG: MFS transporter, partial [Bacteroidota bacterium]
MVSTQSAEQPLYTSVFALLCLSQALFSASFNMIIPELPAYLSAMGGEDYKGFIIGLFTLTAGLSRPFSGKLTDTIGRMPVQIIGTLVCVVASLIYPFATTVFSFLLLRFFHGFSTGFKPTATAAYLADIVPAARRGEGMGILGVSMQVGASIAPPIGSWVATSYSIDWMFYISSFMALLSVLILLGMKET